MTFCRYRKILVILIGFILAMPPPVFAQDARLTNIVVTNTRDDLLIYLGVEGAFREKMKKAILSGVPTSFSFLIGLYQVRSLWFDREIVNLKITHTIKYNSLKKEFFVKRSWEEGEPRVTQSFKQAQKWMSEVDSLRIISLSRLKKGTHYQIRCKAELSKVTLPFYLHYILFFLSLWNFETDWYTIDFVY